MGYLDDGTKIVAHTSLCATGIAYRRLNLPNEDQFLGAGLYYGAGASEAPLVRDEHVVIVGGGNTGAQAALHFAPYARRITVAIRDDSLKSTVSQYLVDRIYTTPNIEVLTGTELTALDGNEVLEEEDLKDFIGKRQKHPSVLIIDEFGQFSNENITALLSLARSAQLGIVLATQDTASLNNEVTKKLVLANTRTKFLMTPEFPEDIATLAGTTYQLESSIQHQDGESTGVGSARVQHAFKVDMNVRWRADPTRRELSK